jgi:hypothetical protein
VSIILPGSEPQPFVPGSDIENVWNEKHDVNATHEAIQEMLAGGTPNWVKWPQDYKSYAKESFAQEKERSDKMGLGYRWADQKVLADKASREVNGISTREFIERKLRANGIKCAVMGSGWITHGGRPSVALWCVPPTKTNKLRYVSYLEVPMMWEWSVLKLDQHNLPAGEESRGWRTVAVQLVEKGIINEAQCHRIFGAPPANTISARYYRSLWEVRHRKPYDDGDDRDGLGE